MSQVMKYGFPAGQRILCDNPACERVADQIATCQDGPDKTKQISGCNEHIAALITGQRIVKLTALVKPGEYNPEKPKEEAQDKSSEQPVPRAPVERRRTE